MPKSALGYPGGYPGQVTFEPTLLPSQQRRGWQHMEIRQYEKRHRGTSQYVGETTERSIWVKSKVHFTLGHQNNPHFRGGKSEACPGSRS